MIVCILWMGIRLDTNIFHRCDYFLALIIVLFRRVKLEHLEPLVHKDPLGHPELTEPMERMV